MFGMDLDLIPFVSPISLCRSKQSGIGLESGFVDRTEDGERFQKRSVKPSDDNDTNTKYTI